MYHGCLPYLDLVLTRESAEVAVKVLTTGHNPPIARLVEILGRIGPAAQAPIDAALKTAAQGEIRDALQRAREAADCQP